MRGATWKRRERKLQQFTAAHGVVAAAQERDLALQKLSEMDGSYRQTRIDLSETQQRVTELQSTAGYAAGAHNDAGSDCRQS